MVPMEDEKNIITDPFMAESYLSPSQIEIAHQRVQDAKTLADNIACYTLIDSFVRANGKANVEYETLFSLLQNVMTASSDLMKYPTRVKENLPILFMLAYFDYLVLTGVMSEEDITRFQDDAMRYAMKGGPAKA